MILSEYSQQWTLEQADTIANLLIGAITAYKKTTSEQCITETCSLKHLKISTNLPLGNILVIFLPFLFLIFTI